MIITLIRHAETEANAQSILMGGAMDSPLTLKGIAQAQKAQSLFQKIPKDIVYCSSNQRAKDTLAILTDGLDLPVTFLDEIREQNYGDMTGTPVAEIPQDVNQKYFTDPYTFAHSQGESLKDVQDRVQSFFQKYIETQSDHEHITIICHENIIRASIGYMKKLDREITIFRIKNCNFSQYEYANGNYTCRYVNKAAGD